MESKLSDFNEVGGEDQIQQLSMLEILETKLRSESQVVRKIFLK